MKLGRFGLGIAKGMLVTLKHIFRHPITVPYPEKRLVPSRRTRGNELVWSQEKCTGCGTCAKVCHIGAIEIVTKTDLTANRYVVEKYQVDTGYCIHCGLCVEACPYQALYMGYAYECGKYRRQELLQSKEVMKESPEKQVSGFFYPEQAEKLPRQSLLVERNTGRE